MSGMPDASLTTYSILVDNWTAANVSDTTPYFNQPAAEKRLAAEDRDTVTVYHVMGTQPKQGLLNAYYNRTDIVQVDVVTFAGVDRLNLLMTEINRIFNLAAVRSNPTTRPLITKGDSYDATAYDQLIPLQHRTHEGVNRQWWRYVLDIELRGYYIAR